MTGGAGFIGSHVVEALLGDGWRVAVVDDLSRGSLRNVPPDAEMLQAGVETEEAARFVRRFRPDAVAHLAAQVSVGASVTDPARDALTNVVGTIRLLEACRDGGVRQVVLASSAAVYGAPERLPIPEDHPLRPLSPYGVSKLAAETYVRVLRELAQLPWMVLRYANVYGPRQDARGEAGVVAVFLRSLFEGSPFPVHGDGEQRRDFVHVEDVAAATVRAMASHASGHVLNVGTGVASSVLDVAGGMWAAAGRGGRPPVRLCPARAGDIRDSVLDPGRARQVLGWQAILGLGEGLRRTVKAWPLGSTP